MRRLLPAAAAPCVAAALGLVHDRPPARADPPGEGAPGGDPPGEVIVVEGEAPPPPPPSSRVIDARDLALTPRRSTEDLLRLAPGLVTAQHASEGKAPQLLLRGFDAVHGQDLEVRLGGVRVNEPSNVHGQGYVDLGGMIPEAIAAIAVHEGAFRLDQGPFAAAGTLELRLGVPAGLRGHRGTIEAGTTGRVRALALAAPPDRPDEEVVAAEAIADAGFGEGRAIRRVAAVAQTAARAGRLRLTPAIVAHAATWGEPGIVALADVERGAIALDGSHAPGLRSRSSRLTASLALGWARGGDEVDAVAWLTGRRLALDVDYTGYLLDAERGDRRLQVHDDLGAGARAAWRRAFGAWLGAHALAETAVGGLAQREDRLDGAGAPWAHERALAATQALGALGAGLTARAGALRVDAGARADAIAIAAVDRLGDPGAGAARATRGVLSPRLRASWTRGALALHAAAGRGARPPEARAAAAPGGVPGWTAADGAELGVTWDGARASVGAAAFASRSDREAVFDHLAGVVALRGGARRAGADLHVVLRPAAWLELRADLAVVDARFAVTGARVPGVPPVTASVEARAWRGAWAGGAALRGHAPRPLGHGARGQAQAVVDAVVAWRRGPVELGLAIDNVTGARWLEGEYHLASWWDRDQPRSALPRVHVAAGRPFGLRLALTLHR